MNKRKNISILLLLCILASLPAALYAETTADAIAALIDEWESTYGDSDDWRMEDVESKAFFEVPTEDDMPQVEALRFAIEALIEEQGLSVEDFLAYMPYFGFWSNEDRRVWQVCFFGIEAETPPYVVCLYSDDGEIQSIDYGAEG
ncbi:MAG: hypothetical protein FWG37_05110 [Clostridia bacterium]|nr:hypothetical protein [Clostridia bacterium]